MAPASIPTKHDLFLAIDQGGHSSRALVYDGHGTLKAGGKCAVGAQTPQPEWVEQDPEEVLASVRKAVDDAITELGDEARHIVAAGMATQRSSLVCWDRESGEALTPIISWQDRRAAHWLEQLPLDREVVHRTTGLFVTAHYGASKFRWCLDNIPAVKDALDSGRLALGPMASFLAFRLLEEQPYVADPANASRTQLWNIKTHDWDQGLMQLFGLPIDLFPKCVPSVYPFGTLKAGDRAIPFTLLNGDQSAALFAFGEIQVETAYINIGTGAFVSRPSGHYPGFARRLLTSVILQTDSDSTYVTEGTVNGAASALDWLEQNHGVGNWYDKLPDWLAREDEPLLFLNGIAGLGAPYWVPDFPSRFTVDGEDWQKAVAVVESIVFLLRVNMEEMQKSASPPLQIQVTGGLAALDGLCQRLADLSRMPVYRPVEREATARGTAYLLANCPDDWPENDIGLWFKPRDNATLHRRYSQWQKVMLETMRQDASD
jgi:glycerol kinase